MLDAAENIVLVHYLEGMASRRMLTGRDADGSANESDKARKRRGGELDVHGGGRAKRVAEHNAFGYDPERLHRPDNGRMPGMVMTVRSPPGYHDLQAGRS